MMSLPPCVYLFVCIVVFDFVLVFVFLIIFKLPLMETMTTSQDFLLLICHCPWHDVHVRVVFGFVFLTISTGGNNVNKTQGKLCRSL